MSLLYLVKVRILPTWSLLVSCSLCKYYWIIWKQPNTWALLVTSCRIHLKTAAHVDLSKHFLLSSPLRGALCECLIFALTFTCLLFHTIKTVELLCVTGVCVAEIKLWPAEARLGYSSPVCSMSGKMRFFFSSHLEKGHVVSSDLKYLCSADRSYK